LIHELGRGREERPREKAKQGETVLLSRVTADDTRASTGGDEVFLIVPRHEKPTRKQLVRSEEGFDEEGDFP